MLRCLLSSLKRHDGSAGEHLGMYLDRLPGGLPAHQFLMVAWMNRVPQHPESQSRGRFSAPSGPAPFLTMVKGSVVTVPRRGGGLGGVSCFGSIGADGRGCCSGWSVTGAYLPSSRNIAPFCDGEGVDGLRPELQRRARRSLLLGIGGRRNLLLLISVIGHSVTLPLPR